MYTKEQRHEIYKKALDFLIEYGYFGYMCNAIHLVSGKYPSDMSVYPEILKGKPTVGKYASYWFPFNKQGHEKRIEILKQAIKETE